MCECLCCMFCVLCIHVSCSVLCQLMRFDYRYPIVQLPYLRSVLICGYSYMHVVLSWLPSSLRRLAVNDRYMSTHTDYMTALVLLAYVDHS